MRERRSLTHPDVAARIAERDVQRRVARVLGRVRRYTIPALSDAARHSIYVGTEIRQRHGRGLDLFQLQFLLGRELAGELSERAHRHSQRNSKLEAMGKTQMALIGRGLLTTSEVLCLLETGHGKGAMARARTIHELAVVSDFVAKRGLRAAQRYVDYYDLDRLKAERAKLKELKKKRRGRRRAPERAQAIREIERDIGELEKRRRRHVRKHGSRFKDEYGWAAAWWGRQTKRINFAMIEERVKLDRARPYYKRASVAVHAGPLGVLDSYGDDGEYITGASVDDVELPATNAPMWLAHLCATATSGIDGRASSLLPRVVAMMSLALDIREAFNDGR